MKININLILLLASVFLLIVSCKKDITESRTYYVNSQSGNDSNDGLSPESAWKTLKKAGETSFVGGDQLLLNAGCVFPGQLDIKVNGDKSAPVLISSYGTDSQLPLIDAKGFEAAISIINGSNFEISNIELTADGGEPCDPGAESKRYGIYFAGDKPGIYENIHFRNIKIHHIFATENIKGDGQNPTSNMGYGIFIEMKQPDARIKNIIIEGCDISMTGHTGIRVFGHRDSKTYVDSLTIIKNNLKHIGGPGMVPGLCSNVVVRENIVDHSGSSIDPRMHARGSGIWPWTCNNVLIEKNKFMHARGKADSCGAHIDYDCNDVIVQYNLSLDNAGGFVEILGNDSNCCYRYNISINDGFRIKGENGAHQEGKVLWTSGYTGGNNKKRGPFNSYIYNNTVFVKEDIRTCFSFTRTTDGMLIANNIFYILGPTDDVSDDQDTRVADSTLSISNVIFTNNLYASANVIPASLAISDSNPLFGSPLFLNMGSINPVDYVPLSKELIKDKGIKIYSLPGDKQGLIMDFEVKTDFLGNPVSGLPDIGAIEME